MYVLPTLATHFAMHPSQPVVLTIAGSDSGGGAGIQADIKTFAALGCHGVSALTAVTAQNTRQVVAVWKVPLDMLRAQLDALFGDFDIKAVKTGMLGDAHVVRDVAAALRRFAPPHIVVDPVMVATSGDSLLDPNALACLREELIPLASLLTPNIPEAEILLGCTINSSELADAASRLRQTGSAAVLLKGGHAWESGPVCDVLVDAAGTLRFEHPRLPLVGHGTGCTLAAACTAYLARGAELRSATASAIDYVHAALRLAFKPGLGNVAVLNHFAAGREHS